MRKKVEWKISVKYLLSMSEIEEITGRKYTVRYDSCIGAYLAEVDGKDMTLIITKYYMDEIVKNSSFLSKIKESPLVQDFKTYFMIEEQRPFFVAEVLMDETMTENDAR